MLMRTPWQSWQVKSPISPHARLMLARPNRVDQLWSRKHGTDEGFVQRCKQPGFDDDIGSSCCIPRCIRVTSNARGTAVCWFADRDATGHPRPSRAQASCARPEAGDSPCPEANRAEQPRGSRCAKPCPIKPHRCEAIDTDRARHAQAGVSSGWTVHLAIHAEGLGGVSFRSRKCRPLGSLP